MRPFRFGLQVTAPTSLEQWQAIARQAETDGYATLMVPDHLSRQSTFPSLMAAAAVTSTIKLASYVLNQDWRPPGILAQEAATVQLFTGGRLELGLGAGWARHEYTQSGIAFDPGPERVRRFGEYARILKELLHAQDPYSFNGEFYTLKDYLPLHKSPHGPPPILIGGGSPHMLRISGALADIISVSVRATPDGRHDLRNLTRTAVDEKISRIRDTAGPRFPEIELNMTMREIRVTEDRAQAARDLLTHWATFPRRLAYVETLSEQDVLESPHIALGTVDEIVTQLEYQREHWGLSYLQIGFADREASAPVLARLARQPAIPAR